MLSELKTIFHELSGAWIAIGTGLTVTTGVITFVTVKVWKPMRALLHMPVDVAAIKKQVFPNGGLSLMDSNTRTEEQITTMTATIDLMMSHQDIAKFTADQRGKCTDANRPLLDLVDAQLNDFLGSNWITFVTEEDRERVNKEWIQSVLDERVMVIEYTMQCTGGEKFKVQVKTRVLKMGQKVIGYIGTVKKR